MDKETFEARGKRLMDALQQNLQLQRRAREQAEQLKAQEWGIRGRIAELNDLWTSSQAEVEEKEEPPVPGPLPRPMRKRGK